MQDNAHQFHTRSWYQNIYQTIYCQEREKGKKCFSELKYTPFSARWGFHPHQTKQWLQPYVLPSFLSPKKTKQRRIKISNDTNLFHWNLPRMETKQKKQAIMDLKVYSWTNMYLGFCGNLIKNSNLPLIFKEKGGEYEK